MDLFDLSGRVAIVTGGGGGIGRGLAIVLAEAGADVVVAGRTERALAETCRQIADRGVRASSIVVDVTKPAEVARAFDRVADRAGRLDILVNSAGRQPCPPGVGLPAEGRGRPPGRHA